MADYSMVREKSGKVLGLWLRNPEDAQNRDLLSMLLIKHNLPNDLCAVVLEGGYRVVPNTFDDAGGCFVMFESEPAPGETPAASKKIAPPPSEKTAPAPGKKWWQFWK